MSKIIDGDSQCPTCGSVVMSDEIELPSSLNAYSFGFLCGVIGALGCATVLWIGGCIQFAV